MKKERLTDEDVRRKAELKLEIKRRYPLFFLKMNPVQEIFIRVKNSRGRTPRRRILEAGNKLGKTYMGVGEDIAHMIGYRPWLKEDDPDYRIDVAVPNIGMVAGETIMHSIAEKLEPTFRLLIPDFCKPVFKPGPTGAVIKVTLPFDVDGRKCGSVAYFRSYDQRPATFEGIDAHWIHWDEPPPEEILIAAERGKVVTNAPSWFTMTPLKEPYIFDKFSRRAAHVF